MKPYLVSREGLKRTALWGAVLAFFWITALKSPLATRAIPATNAEEPGAVTVDSVTTTSSAPVAPADAPSIEDALDGWTARLESIDTSDTDGMRAFRAEFSVWVRQHQDHLGPEMHRWMADVNERTLRASFFIAAGILSEADHPENFVAELLQAEERPLAPVADLDGDHAESERVSRSSVVTVFALSEFQARLRAESADFRHSLQPELLTELVRAAENSPDLSIVRESVKTLLLATDDPSRYLTEIRESRSPGELFAIEDLFNGI